MMTTEDLVMIIDKAHFVVKLHKTLLQVDLKEGAKKKLEDALEAHPTLRDSVGLLFQTIIPLDIPLRDIDSASADEKGRVKIAIPHRRDIHIPLEQNESKRLVEQLNELIPAEKARAIQELEESDKAKKAFNAERTMMGTEAFRERPSGRD
jgi:hypothetical protein